MAKRVKVTNLNVIFGKPQQQSRALEMVNEGISSHEIRETTGATVAVRNVNLDIKENELFVIVGLSGSGKSSLIRTLNLLNKPASGSIEVGGVELSTMNKLELRNYRRNDVSMVFQHFGLLSHRTVLDNVIYPLEIQGVEKTEARSIAMEAIELVGLDGWEMQYPDQLSGGMRQRVGLARALTNDPQLLLMDEPYSALDPLIRREMQKELLSLEDNMDRTIVFITHDMNEAFKMGDRIALMKDGEIVQIGTPSEFFEKPANDYVKSFIEDVDKTRILKVRSIMRKPHFTALPTDSVEATLEKLNTHDRDFCYVVDEDKRFLGYVKKDSLTKSKQKVIKRHVKKDDTVIYRNAYLKDAWEKLGQANYNDIAVVDSKHRLRGVLDYDEIIEALT